MNINNITKIQLGKLWIKMVSNKYYRGYVILDNYRKPECQRIDGQFFVLLVFFEGKVKDLTLNKYQKEGTMLSKNEGLDKPKPYKFYGTMKMLQFS